METILNRAISVLLIATTLYISAHLVAWGKRGFNIAGASNGMIIAEGINGNIQ